jgi:hypothetical protein
MWAWGLLTVKKTSCPFSVTDVTIVNLFPVFSYVRIHKGRKLEKG